MSFDPAHVFKILQQKRFYTTTAVIFILQYEIISSIKQRKYHFKVML